MILAGLGIWVYRLSRKLRDDYLVQLRDGKVGGFQHAPAAGEKGKKKR
jgi:hypothetical protein